MPYFITKHITAKKTTLPKRFLNLLILVLAVPVLVIAFLSILLYSFLNWLKSLLLDHHPEAPVETYHEELMLIERQNLRVVLIEDESDEELLVLNEAWSEKVHSGDTCLYRVKTNPVISGLHQTICCFYLRENEYGAFLQQLVLNEEDTLNTQMIFLDYHSLQLEVIGAIGAFHLVNKEQSPSISGSSKIEKIEIALDQSPYLSTR